MVHTNLPSSTSIKTIFIIQKDGNLLNYQIINLTNTKKILLKIVFVLEQVTGVEPVLPTLLFNFCNRSLSRRVLYPIELRTRKTLHLPDKVRDLSRQLIKL